MTGEYGLCRADKGTRTTSGEYGDCFPGSQASKPGTRMKSLSNYGKPDDARYVVLLFSF